MKRTITILLVVTALYRSFRQHDLSNKSSGAKAPEGH